MDIRPTESVGHDRTCEECGDPIPRDAAVEDGSHLRCEVCHSRTLKQSYTTRRRHREEEAEVDPADSDAVAEAAARDEVAALQREEADLEYRLRKTPDDLKLLERLLDIAERLEHGEDAAEIRRRICQRSPSHPRVQGKRIAQRKDRVIEVPEEGLGVREQLAVALHFPLRGRGFSMLIVGSLLLLIGRAAAGALFHFVVTMQGTYVIGAVALLAVWGLVLRQLAQVANHSARGVTEMPAWDEFQDFFASMLSPAVGMIGCLLFSASPLLIVLAVRSSAPGGETLMLIPAGVAILMGLYIAPIVFLAYSRFQSLHAIGQVSFLAGSVSRTRVAYHRLVMQCALLVGAATLVVVPLEIARRGSGPGTLAYYVLTSFVAMWLGTAAFYLLGRFYLENQVELNWFDEVVRAEAPRPPYGPFTFDEPQGKGPTASPAPEEGAAPVKAPTVPRGERPAPEESATPPIA